MEQRQEPDGPPKDADEHYEECPRRTSRRRPCRCEAINAETEDYYTEPADMFAREWGCY
ncbi:hypothetical protein ACF09H_29805 [Streptomyces sp. NPDC014983]|uniref:hypothetical protein n=1 Tax=Streptomyces sp. NPDC014983 TaxID=3364933 RepID=UPI0037033773